MMIIDRFSVAIPSRLPCRFMKGPSVIRGCVRHRVERLTDENRIPIPYNAIFRSVNAALGFTHEQQVEIANAGGVTYSKSMVSSFWRAPDHRLYRRVKPPDLVGYLKSVRDHITRTTQEVDVLEALDSLIPKVEDKQNKVYKPDLAFWADYGRARERNVPDPLKY